MKRWLLNFLLKRLYNAVTDAEVLRWDGKMFHRGDKIVPPDEAKAIVSGARSLKYLDTWTELVTDLKYVCNKRMYEQSTSDADMVFGKAGLYILDLMERKVDNLSKINIE